MTDILITAAEARNVSRAHGESQRVAPHVAAIMSKVREACKRGEWAVQIVCDDIAPIPYDDGWEEARESWESIQNILRSYGFSAYRCSARNPVNPDGDFRNVLDVSWDQASDE